MSDQVLVGKVVSSRMSVTAYVRVLVLGMVFGLVLVKSEVVSWERIHKMFLFQEAHMFLIIGTAVIVGGLSMLIIRRFQLKDLNGKRIAYVPKPFHKGVVLGGIIFGMGWAITGACPGPIYAQMGTGAWPAVFTFIGALFGMYLYAAWRPKLPH